ncbi:MAG: peptidylprolyl isomerase [bacterium]
MFESLRKMILPIIIIVLFFFVAMIVLQWGLGLDRRSQFTDANVAAVINGEEVSWQEYNRAYNALYQAEAFETEEELPETKVRELHQQAWRQLLHDRLIKQELVKKNYVVTDDELYAFLRYNPPPELQQIPQFQTDGKFDYQKYFSAMADPQASSFWASIEPFARENILKQKLQESVIMAARVTEWEIRDLYRSEREKIKVGAINIPFARFSKPPPKNTDEELLEYYTEHQNEYTIEERAALSLAMIEKEPKPLDWERSYNEAMVLLDSIRAGADFAELAGRYSQDPGSAAQDGDLGWFPRGQMVEEFDRKAFSMKEGEVSEPIRTQFGWHIIKLYGFKEELEILRGQTEEQLVKKAHASHILIKAEPGQETLDRAYRRLEDFRSAAISDGFFKAAEDLAMPIKQIQPFFRGGNIQFLGRDAQAGLFAFDNEVDAISEVMENQSAYYVVRVAQRMEAGMANFEESGEKVSMDLLKYKVTKLCRDTADAIYAEILKGTDPKKAAEMFGALYETLEEFNRYGSIKGVGRDPVAIGAAFSLTEPDQISKPINYDQGCIIYKLQERSSLDLSDYNRQRDSLYTIILNNKRQGTYGRWFENLLDNSEVQNNVDKALAEGAEF